MQTIIIDNSDFNYILSQQKKLDLQQFISWYEKITPEYLFIKDKKKTFQKNSKNIYSSQSIPSLKIGEDISWDKVFFINHDRFLAPFVEILSNKNFDYWTNYLNYVYELKNLPLSNCYDIICYALENSDFLNKNSNKIIKLINKSILLISNINHKEYIEKYLNIFEFSIGNRLFDIEWLLQCVSHLTQFLAPEQIKYHFKNIFSTNNILDLEVDTTKLHSEILPYLKKQRTHQYIVGTGFHFTINTLLFSISPSYSQKLTQAQINYQLNVLSNFIQSIQSEQKCFWFIDSQFKNNNFVINAFPKEDSSLNFLKKIIDICLHDKNDEASLEITLNELYLEICTPISIPSKKQEINKF